MEKRYEDIQKITDEIKNEREPDENCDHIWEQRACWDGSDEKGNKIDKQGWIGGPLAKCRNCSGVRRFRWHEWKTLPQEKRIGLPVRADDNW